MLLLFGGAIAWYALAWLTTGSPFAARSNGSTWTFSYAYLCLIAAAATVPCWFWPRLLSREPEQLTHGESRTIDVVAAVGEIPLHGQGKWLALIPGNECLHLQVTKKTLQLAALPAALKGLTITHLSDLHFTGSIGQAYFDYVVSEANQLASDVLVISGDIIESTACEPWIVETLGRLQAPLGKYYVLGNHDKRMPDVSHVRELLNGIGFVDLGGRCLKAIWRDCEVLLAGNERPWFPAASEAEIAKFAEQAGLKLLVAHSPDQLNWARKHQFNLMLAGHNHGGQVRLPLVGALISPSLYGTRYSGGVYYQAPTLLHVSRGISGEHPLRWNCLPEVTQLTLN